MSRKTEASPAVGHNSSAEMKSYIERLENLETEKQSFVDDIRDLCAEAKGKGYSPKALKAIVKEKMMSSDKREALREHEETVDTYKAALGMLD